VYAKGRENFLGLIRKGALIQDPQACFYLYRQVMGSHSQLGVVAVTSCEEYAKGMIKKHELTRPDKELDRVRHIEALDAQTGPAFLTYRSVPEFTAALDRRAQEPAQVDFTSPDGVRHTSWTIGDAETIELIRQTFEQIPALYIADGHHRSAAAARVYRARQGQGNSGAFLRVIFPHDRMRILAYHRVLRDLHGRSPAALLEKLDGVFVIRNTGRAAPTRKHEICLYLQGQWHTLSFRPHFAAARDPFERLDVTLLQNFVLAPLFGIEDPRKSDRIHFIGGIRGTAELERVVDAGEYACAFSMFPTSMDDLMKIADAGRVMPPKSTWFEPKLRDGMFCHRI
jgi:uncharacterized protein (DUF1015 family)